jgi:hypothetical protein
MANGGTGKHERRHDCYILCVNQPIHVLLVVPPPIARIPFALALFLLRYPVYHTRPCFPICSPTRTQFSVVSGLISCATPVFFLNPPHSFLFLLHLKRVLSRTCRIVDNGLNSFTLSRPSLFTSFYILSLLHLVFGVYT